MRKTENRLEKIEVLRHVKITAKEGAQVRRTLGITVKDSNFTLDKQLKPINSTGILQTVKQQVNAYQTMRTKARWTAFIAGNLLDKPKLIASALLQYRSLSGDKIFWLRGTQQPSSEPGIYVIDALFQDESPYRRTQIYDKISALPSGSSYMLLVKGEAVAACYHIGIEPDYLMQFGM